MFTHFKKLVLALILIILFTMLITVAFATNISSFDDLVPHLTKKSKSVWISSSSSANEFYYELNPGDYVFTNDFEIDINNPFFSDTDVPFNYGIIGLNGGYNIDGNSKTVTIKGKSELFSLFSDIFVTVGNSVEIKNMNLVYQGNVLGAGFARDIHKEQDKGSQPSKIHGLNIIVKGSILPQIAKGLSTRSNAFVDSFQGYMASGLCYGTTHFIYDDIKLNVEKNIGDITKNPADNQLSAANGLFNYMMRNYADDNYHNELFNKLNYEHLKNNGHLINVEINVGGNIEAHGNDKAFAYGVGHNLGMCWIDNLHIDVKGDIKTIMDGGGTKTYFEKATTSGFGDLIMNLTNSSLSVNNLSAVRTAKGVNYDDLIVVGIGFNNNIGNYINIANNTIDIKGKIEASSPHGALTSAGFLNVWSSSGKDGVNWSQFYHDNVFNVANVEIATPTAQTAQFYGICYRFRTGINPLGTATIPEASLRNNSIKIGNLSIKNQGGTAYVSGLSYNSSNAKNNTVEIKNLDVETGAAHVFGLGHIRSENPVENPYNPIADGNTVIIDKFKVVADTASYITAYAAYVDEPETIKNAAVHIGAFDVTVAGATKSDFYSALVAFNKGIVDNAKAYLGNVQLRRGDAGNVGAYFGLAAGYSNNTAKISNVSVFVDKDLDLNAPRRMQSGGMYGLLYSDVENCNLQIDGEFIQNGGVIAGAFAGYSNNNTIKYSSTYLLNSYAPFVFYASGAVLDNVAHYLNNIPSPNLQGLLLTAPTTNAANLPVIKNSTLIVEKPLEEVKLYAENKVKAESGNNFLVVVETDEKLPNRFAYATASNGTNISKTGDPIGKINIALRSFQDKYWNSAVAPYIITAEEKSFEYINKNDGAGTIRLMGLNSDISNDNGNSLNLRDYFNRHVLIKAEAGPIYDILGIKGSNLVLPVAPNPTFSPSPTPEASPTIKVESKSVPNTGDNTPISAALTLMLIMALALGCLGKKYINNK